MEEQKRSLFMRQVFVHDLSQTHLAFIQEARLIKVLPSNIKGTAD